VASEARVSPRVRRFIICRAVYIRKWHGHTDARQPPFDATAAHLPRLRTYRLCIYLPAAVVDAVESPAHLLLSSLAQAQRRAIIEDRGYVVARTGFLTGYHARTAGSVGEVHRAAVIGTRCCPRGPHPPGGSGARLSAAEGGMASLRRNAAAPFWRDMAGRAPEAFYGRRIAACRSGVVHQRSCRYCRLSATHSRAAAPECLCFHIDKMVSAQCLSAIELRSRPGR